MTFQKHLLILGLRLSTNTVIKPQRKNKVVKKISALLYDLFVDIIKLYYKIMIHRFLFSPMLINHYN